MNVKQDYYLSSVLDICGYSKAADLMDIIFSEFPSVGWALAL